MEKNKEGKGPKGHRYLMSLFVSQSETASAQTSIISADPKIYYLEKLPSHLLSRQHATTPHNPP
jgi:hypothetical protein